MLAKIVSDNREYYSHIFAKFSPGWYECVIVFDTENKRFELLNVYNTKPSLKRKVFIIDTDIADMVEKKEIKLSVETPCHEAEIQELFEMIDRIRSYWNCRIYVSDEKKPTDPSGLKMCHVNASRYNRDHLSGLIYKYLEDEEAVVDLGCACWPLSMGQKELKYFAEHPGHFDHWLHRAQVMDAYFSYPDFWVKQDGTLEGQYLLVEEAENLLPYDPAAGHWETDKKTGNPMVADEYRIFFFISPSRDEIVDLPYSVFIRSMDASKAKAYDKRRFWMAPLSYEELAEIYRKGQEICNH